MPVPEESAFDDLDFTADVRFMLDNANSETARKPQKKKDYSINEFLSHQANAQNDNYSQQSLLRQLSQRKEA